jgi:hypothetical protein
LFLRKYDEKNSKEKKSRMSLTQKKAESSLSLSSSSIAGSEKKSIFFLPLSLA